MAVSTKTKERLRRWAGVALPKCGTLLTGFCVLGVAILFTGNIMRVVTVTDSDGAESSIITAAQDTNEIMAQARIAPAGGTDAVLFSEEDYADNIHVLRSFDVTLTADGETKPLTITECTVAQILEQQGIPLGEFDRIEPSLDTLLTEQTEIVLQRVRYEEYTVQEVLPMETQYVETSLFYRNKDFTMEIQEGCDGLADITYKDTYIDDVWTGKEEISRVVQTEMVPEITKIYGETAPVSAYVGPEIVDGAPAEGVAAVYTGKRATGYSAGPTSKGASRRWLNYGTVAINPNIIPYGSLMYITSDDGRFIYGYAYAADTGTAMMDGRAFIDLYYETYDESVKNAVIPVTIYVLDEETAARYQEQNDAIQQADTLVGKP